MRLDFINGGHRLEGVYGSYVLLSMFPVINVKQYQKLITTLCVLLKNYKPRADTADVMETSQKAGSYVGIPQPAFLMSWRRRIGKEDESLFFNGCEDAGLEVEHIGSRVYCIKPRE
ncbi:hypothetical protein EUGRSUZ_B02818 [Eucalyptus grandis]|uniref:Uncharacterized protein n=2 Tax=Eucalyptus grandis TaxID=71139 RepID=A0ACC3M1T1_EUCGR|nr:hypothetical protein EUGRSUZ_B02818 [Eucalyptus grandis]